MERELERDRQISISGMGRPLGGRDRSGSRININTPLPRLLTNRPRQKMKSFPFQPGVPCVWRSFSSLWKDDVDGDEPFGSGGGRGRGQVVVVLVVRTTNNNFPTHLARGARWKFIQLLFPLEGGGTTKTPAKITSKGFGGHFKCKPQQRYLLTNVCTGAF